MPGTSASFLPYLQRLSAQPVLTEDWLLAGYVCLLEQTIDYERLKQDYPEVEFIGLVGFDTTRQKFILFGMDQAAHRQAEERKLSEREQEVLQWVARGYTNFQIAQQLAITENTVKAHLQNIFAKLKVQSRTEAAMQAVQRGWVGG